MRRSPRCCWRRRCSRASSRLRRGRVRTDVDLDDVVDMLYGPIYHRLVLHTRRSRATVIRLAFEALTSTE
ncbi:TetR/AcrR family transcriptional regulator C-terminal ligand-binding domain-containing protein [Actinomadura rudentiformis]|uniref:Tetracyclin repressor-like C-terminal domain-containing protein n=1 Tax=Actinomadura rudentiformis TaxID=359158 RepID=A0A6H9YN80_9ACTN|nr:hypothetical protein F8566_45575 [Actinomadura rudentiformis]